MSCNNQSRVTNERSGCCRCQHCVDVQGMEEQIVCLAYLTIRNPVSDGTCDEFECKHRKAAFFTGD